MEFRWQSSFTISVKFDQFSTLNARMSRTEALNQNEVTTLPEEYPSELVLDGNDQSQERILFNVDNLAFNPVWLCSQLRANLHSISNLWFHNLQSLSFHRCKFTNFLSNPQAFVDKIMFIMHILFLFSFLPAPADKKKWLTLQGESLRAILKFL